MKREYIEQIKDMYLNAVESRYYPISTFDGYQSTNSSDECTCHQNSANNSEEEVLIWAFTVDTLDINNIGKAVTTAGTCLLVEDNHHPPLCPIYACKDEKCTQCEEWEYEQ